jgi:hypothetical protein
MSASVAFRNFACQDCYSLVDFGRASALETPFIYVVHNPMPAFVRKSLPKVVFPFSSLNMKRISFAFGLASAIEPGAIPVNVQPARRHMFQLVIPGEEDHRLVFWKPFRVLGM